MSRSWRVMPIRPRFARLRARRHHSGTSRALRVHFRAIFRNGPCTNIKDRHVLRENQSAPLCLASCSAWPTPARSLGDTPLGLRAHLSDPARPSVETPSWPPTRTQDPPRCPVVLFAPRGSLDMAGVHSFKAAALCPNASMYSGACIYLRGQGLLPPLRACATSPRGSTGRTTSNLPLRTGKRRLQWRTSATADRRGGRGDKLAASGGRQWPPFLSPR